MERMRRRPLRVAQRQLGGSAVRDAARDMCGHRPGQLGGRRTAERSGGDGGEGVSPAQCTTHEHWRPWTLELDSTGRHNAPSL